MSPRHILLAIGIATVLGASFVAIHYGLEDAPPLLLTALRYIFAALPAVFFIKRPQIDLRLLIAYGLFVGVGQFGLLFIAIALGMPAGLASLVVQLQVFFTMLFALIVFGERPQRWQVIGAIIAFAGIGVIATERLEGAALLPLLLTIGAAMFWGMGNMASKKAGRVDMLGLVVWSSLVPPLPLLGLSLLVDGPAVIVDALTHFSWRGAGAVAFMAYGATVFGFSMWARLLSLYPASQVAPFALLIPVAGIGSAALLLGEEITLIEVIGCLVVLAGLLVNIFGARIVRRFA
ncbi:EamA family transporter [Devosia sp.]|jgi:O-acetylserine/cysteine efflux transporter|uniref:EamA family transporter n=1 Tax=Devosia sp. TaxID=1871048 RepID=UPI0037BEC328